MRGGRGGGDGGMRWKESGLRGGTEWGVTLTEPAVDKTLRQIRQSRECGASFVFHCSSCLVASPFSSALDASLNLLKLFCSSCTGPPLLAPSWAAPSVIGPVRYDRPWTEGTFSPLASSLRFCFSLLVFF